MKTVAERSGGEREREKGVCDLEIQKEKGKMGVLWDGLNVTKWGKPAS